MCRHFFPQTNLFYVYFIVLPTGFEFHEAMHFILFHGIASAPRIGHRVEWMLNTCLLDEWMDGWMEGGTYKCLYISMHLWLYGEYRYINLWVSLPLWHSSCSITGTWTFTHRVKEPSACSNSALCSQWWPPWGIWERREHWRQLLGRLWVRPSPWPSWTCAVTSQWPSVSAASREGKWTCLVSLSIPWGHLPPPWPKQRPSITARPLQCLGTSPLVSPVTTDMVQKG